jgi:two-component system sensor histidine kinase YesM
MNKLFEKLNNFTLFQKMALIYVTCIIIPLCVIGVFYYNVTIKKIEIEREKDINFLLNKAKENIQNHIYQPLLWTSRLCMDETLYDLLTYEYDSYSGRRKVLDYIDNIISYPLYGDGISKVEVYSDNMTLHSGITLKKIDRWATDREWYKKNKSNNTDVSIISYDVFFEDSNVGTRYLSIIQNMNFYSEYDGEKFVKLDINVDFFKSILKDLNIDGTVFLVDENDKVITHTNTNNIYPECIDATYKVELDFNDLNGWKIVAESKKLTIGKTHLSDIITFLIIMMLITAFTFIVIYMVSKSITGRFKKLTECMNKMENQMFEPIPEDGMGSDEIAVLINGMNKLTIKTRQLIEDVYRSEIRQNMIEIEKRQAELNAMQSQINPHFLFNTLETIRLKSLKKKEVETGDIIKYLSKMFRRMISWGEDIIKFSEELECIDEYLKIQKYRFGSELKIIKNIDEDCLCCTLPKMVLQVFVENACVHGAESVTGEKKIKIDIKCERDMLVFMIEDNGIGIDKRTIETILSGESEKGKNIGTSNAINRLKYYYNGRFKINIDSIKGKMTRVVIEIPQKEISYG